MKTSEKLDKKIEKESVDNAKKYETNLRSDKKPHYKTDAEFTANYFGRIGGFNSGSELLKPLLLEMITALEEIITHVKPHRDGLDGRFEETKSTIVACNALSKLDEFLK
jgi:hypothetical protein